jgi:hypothetical protein
MHTPPLESSIEWGYWPAMERAGLIPSPIQNPDEYDGAEIVNLCCTQTGLSPSKQRALVRSWCQLLPETSITTLVFRSRVSQPLFEAALRIRSLSALFVKWGGLTDLEPCLGHPGLTSLYIGSSPSLTGLGHLTSVTQLTHLFLNDVRQASQLEYVYGLNKLLEFGLGGRSLRVRVASLEPIAALQNLATLWLVNVSAADKSLEHLYALRSLRSFRTDRDPDSREIVSMCEAIPTLQYLRPVWGGYK